MVLSQTSALSTEIASTDFSFQLLALGGSLTSREIFEIFDSVVAMHVPFHYGQ